MKKWLCKAPINSWTGTSFSKRIRYPYLSQNSPYMVEVCLIPIPSWFSNSGLPDESSNEGDIWRRCRSTLQCTLFNQQNKLGPWVG